jgi:hypothetical protein
MFQRNLILRAILDMIRIVVCDRVHVDQAQNFSA